MATRLIDEYFCRLFYGGDFNLTPEDMPRWAAALALIIGADGISGKERQYWIEIGKHMGVPLEMIKATVEMDVSKLKPEEVLKGFKDGGPARAMLYQAIKVASVDGFSEKERAYAARTAKLLGIDGNVLQAIESLVETEAALQRTKCALLMAHP